VSRKYWVHSTWSSLLIKNLAWYFWILFIFFDCFMLPSFFLCPIHLSLLDMFSKLSDLNIHSLRVKSGFPTSFLHSGFLHNLAVCLLFLSIINFVLTSKILVKLTVLPFPFKPLLSWPFTYLSGSSLFSSMPHVVSSTSATHICLTKFFTLLQVCT